MSHHVLKPSLFGQMTSSRTADTIPNEPGVGTSETRKLGTGPRSVAKKRRSPLVVALFVGVVTACAVIWHFVNRVEAPAATLAAPATPVSVETVEAQKMRLWNNFSGRLRAVNSAEIRPEVSGRITEVRFKDGQSVKAGEILFVIDPRPFEAAVARAQARIASANAALQFATAEQARNAALLKTHVIPQRDYDQTDATKNGSAADLLAAQADLKTAEIDLDHAYVKAPISGRVSRAEITIGNFVGSGASAPVLASIVSEDGIYADFEVDEQTYLDTIRDAANGNAQEETIPVQLVIPEDPERVFKGFVQNFDNRLNSSSGTIRARARFDNSDGSLVPGMFVSVRLASSQERKLILVNDRSISFDQSKTTVLTVTLENKVAYREIVLGAALVGKHVALKGLRDGDRVIVTGVQRVRPGALVAPKKYDPREEDSPAAEATAPVKED